jgi:hypothetical protein
MGVVSAYAGSSAGVAGSVPANQYLGATSQVGHTAVGGNHIVPALDWSGGRSEGESAEIEVDDFVWIKPSGDIPEVQIIPPEAVSYDDDIPKEWNLSDTFEDEFLDPDFDPDVDPLDVDDDDDDDLEPWVEEEYGGLHEGLEHVIVSKETEPTPIKRGPGRPKKVKVS